MARKKALTEQNKSSRRTSQNSSDGLEGVSFYLGRAYYRYIALVESSLREAGVSERVRPGMGHVLFALYEKDDRVIKEIVERADVSPSTLTGILRQMEKHGLIVRRADATDSRAVRVRLTALGRSLQKRLRQVQASVHRIMYADLTSAELQSVRHALARMTLAMRDHEGSRHSSSGSSTK